MDTAADIMLRASAHSGTKVEDINPNDILGSCGLAGDDADEFLYGLMDDYDINFDGFLGYLHYNGNEPPITVTAWGVDADGKRMDFLPISLDDFVQAAETKTWAMTYPDHRLVQRDPLRIALWILAPLAVFVLLTKLF